MQHLWEQNSGIIFGETQRHDHQESWVEQAVSGVFRVPEKVSQKRRVAETD